MTDKQSILIGNEGGNLYHFEPAKDSLVPIFKDDINEVIMGLEKRDGFLFVAAKSKIFKFERDNFILIKTFSVDFEGWITRPDFHNIKIINNFLYVTVTKRNEVWKFDLDLNLHKKYRIDPPNRHARIRSADKFGINYNHLNNIFYNDNKFYVCLNILIEPYGMSGVCVLNSDMEEVDRFEYGWEAHNFIILDGKKLILCGSSGAIKKVNHPHKGGLLVDGKLAFEYNPDLYFCKDFSIDENYIYIVGGTVKKRGYRALANGILFILDRTFKPIFEREFVHSGGFCGCLLSDCDFSRVGG